MMSQPFSLASAGRAIDGAISRLVHDLTTAPLPPAEMRARALAGFRAARQGTIEMIRGLTQAQADFSPAPKAWSIGQNVQHLLLIEELHRENMRKMIEMARQGRAGNIDLTFQQINTSFAYIPRDLIPVFTTPLRMMNAVIPRAIRETMFRIPLIPAVHPTFSTPVGHQGVEELRSRAQSSIETTEAVFQGEMPPNLNQITTSHPILGTNNIPEILAILSAHEERHHAQMRGVLAKAHFPKA